MNASPPLGPATEIPSARIQPAEGLASDQVRTTATKGVVWSFVQICAERASQAAIFIITARLLGPADFGTAAIAVAPALIANHALQGITQAVIQRDDLGPGYVGASLACAIGSSLLMATLIVAAAPMVSYVVGDALAGDLMRASALAPALAGLGLVQEGMLARRFAFSVLAVRRPLAILVGGTLSIALAYLGFGAWSIIAQTVLVAATGTLVCLMAMPVVPASRFSKTEWRDASASATKLMGRQVLDVASQRLPEALLGFLAGPAAAGLFRLAKALLDLVKSILVYPISAGLLPVFARMSGDRQKLESFALNVSVASVVIVSVPALGFAIFSPMIVRIAVGPAWMQTADIMMIFAMTLPPLALVAAIPSFMVARQQAGTLLWCSAAQLLAAMTLVAFGAWWDVVIASFGFTLSMYIGAGLLWSRSLARSAGRDRRTIRDAFSLVALVEISLVAVFVFRHAFASDRVSIALFAISLAAYIGLVPIAFPRLAECTLQALPAKWRGFGRKLRAG